MIIKLLMKYLQIIYRTTKTVVMRPFVLAKYKLNSITNISKLLNKIPKAFAALLAKLKLKPEKREDYVDAGPVFIAKSLLVILLIIIVATPFLIVYVVWPWVVSLFFTAHFYIGDPKLEDYNGKVEIYYEEKLENLEFRGRLEEGKAVGYGEEFYEDGSIKYMGNFVDGQYEGTGEFHISPGVVYKGEFSKGKRAGHGQIFEDEALIYEGAFADDLYEGEGVEYYSNGQIKYKGTFVAGLYSGQGVFHDEKGTKRYEGNFMDGLFNGEGRYYNEKEELIYTGSFVDGLYDGEGRLIIVPNSIWYEGPFLAGKANGEGKYYKHGQLYYEGTFIDGAFSGAGVLTDAKAGFSYSGTFENNDIAFGELFDLPVTDLYTAFTKGMREDTSDENYFYLYNKGFGLVLKLSYANEVEEAKLVRAFRRPESQEIIPEVVGQSDSNESTSKNKTPANGSSSNSKGTTPGKMGTGILEEKAANLLGIRSRTMNTHISSYEGYDIRYWIDPKTEEIVLLEYFPNNKTESSNLNEEQPSGKVTSGQTDKQYAAYFKDLGLDIADFRSLGFGN